MRFYLADTLTLDFAMLPLLSMDCTVIVWLPWVKLTGLLMLLPAVS